MPKRRPKKLKAESEKLKVNSQEAEKKKLMLMRAGVAGVMVLFFVAWIFNLKYQFKINSNNSGNKSSFNWDQTKADLDKAMGQVKEGLQQIKQAQNTLPVSSELTAEQVNLLKGKLLGEAASSSTATSTKK